MAELMTSVPTTAAYRPRRHAETQFDPPIEIGALLLAGSLSHHTTVASVDPDQVIGSSDDPCLIVLTHGDRPPQWSDPAWDIAEGILETRLKGIPQTVETIGISESLASETLRIGPPAFLAFKDVVRWLGASDNQVAEAVGVGRTTPYSWRRDNREPRPATTRRLYEYHAVLGSLRRRIGSAELRRWLFSGAPSPRDLLLEGHLEQIERDVHQM